MACAGLRTNWRTDKNGYTFWTGYIDGACHTATVFVKGGPAEARAAFLAKYGKPPVLGSLESIRKAVANPVARDPPKAPISVITDPIAKNISDFQRALGQFGAGIGLEGGRAVTAANDVINANPFARTGQLARDEYIKRGGTPPFATPQEIKRAQQNQQTENRDAIDKCSQGDFLACLTTFSQDNPMLVWGGAAVGLILLVLLLSRR